VFLSLLSIWLIVSVRWFARPARSWRRPGCGPGFVSTGGKPGIVNESSHRMPVASSPSPPRSRWVVEGGVSTTRAQVRIVGGAGPGLRRIIHLRQNLVIRTDAAKALPWASALRHASIRP
jgi:hypothetical protein